MGIILRPHLCLAFFSAVTLAAFSFSCSFAADSSLRREDIIGSWYGLRTGPGVTISSARRIEFFANGTYISQNPEARGSYFIEGNTVVVPKLSTFTLRGERLVDSMGILIRNKLVER